MRYNSLLWMTINARNPPLESKEIVHTIHYTRLSGTEKTSWKKKNGRRETRGGFVCLSTHILSSLLILYFSKSKVKCTRVNIHFLRLQKRSRWLTSWILGCPQLPSRIWWVFILFSQLLTWALDYKFIKIHVLYLHFQSCYLTVHWMHRMVNLGATEKWRNGLIDVGCG